MSTHSLMHPPLLSPEALLARPREGLLLLDARPGADVFATGHLAGARRVDTEAHLSGARPGHDAAHGGRHPLPSLATWRGQLDAWGVTPTTHVVVYDAMSGANAAARTWWMLRAAGHGRVSVLDGGFDAAVAAGFPVAQGPEAPTAPATGTAAPDAWSLPTVNLARVEALRQDPHWRVLDVRAAPRFRGETEPIDPVAGHVPGAVNLPFTENLEAGRFKSPEALRRQYLALLGDVPPERLVVHCGSGVTACHTLLALEVAGLPGASLYVGSWSEWCRSGQPIGRS